MKKHVKKSKRRTHLKTMTEVAYKSTVENASSIQTDFRLGTHDATETYLAFYFLIEEIKFLLEECFNLGDKEVLKLNHPVNIEIFFPEYYQDVEVDCTGYKIPMEVVDFWNNMSQAITATEGYDLKELMGFFID